MIENALHYHIGGLCKEGHWHHIPTFQNLIHWCENNALYCIVVFSMQDKQVQWMRFYPLTQIAESEAGRDCVADDFVRGGAMVQ